MDAFGKGWPAALRTVPSIAVWARAVPETRRIRQRTRKQLENMLGGASVMTIPVPCGQDECEGGSLAQAVRALSGVKGPSFERRHTANCYASSGLWVITSMTDNRNSDAAWNYHNATKHSYASVRSNAHFMDWNNQPLPFKIYPTLEPMRLPGEVRQSGVAALSAIAERVPAQTNASPDLEAVAQLLYLSAGITRRRKYSGGEIYFRAAACTGALYEVELYLVCGELGGLEAGVYHFGPAEFGLRKLRAGDYRGALVAATGGEAAVAHTPLTIICTCTYWRNAWKYQARTYRHFGWDNGTLLANLLAVATALGLPAKVVCGFLDASVDRLLDVDTQREVAFSLVALGHAADLPPQEPTETSPLSLETVPLSQREVDYPLMREMHAASSLDSKEEVQVWRGRTPTTDFPPPAAPSISLEPLSDAEMPLDSIEQVIQRRGSTRKFARSPITLAQLSTMLDRAT